MKPQNTKLGFTLIELLVVITIIGILATGGVAVYTSQIQKARDSTRISSLSALQGGLEQVFQDMGRYPGRAITQVTTTECGPNSTDANSSLQCLVQLGYLSTLPKDPKDGQIGRHSFLIFTYNFGTVNGVIGQSSEISAGVEATSLLTAKAANSVDGGNDINRIEFGMTGLNLRTCTAGANGIGNCPNNNSNAPSGVISLNSCSELNATTHAIAIRGNCP